MDKTQLLALIREKVQDGTVSSEEVHQAASSVGEVSTRDTSSHITNIFYIIGAIIAVIGVVILVVQNWHEIGFFGRAVVTAGIAAATYFGALYMTKPHQRILSQVFFAISAVLAPLGIAVFVKQAGMTLNPGIHTLLGLLLGALFLSAFWHTRRNVLVLLSVAYFSWAYFASIAGLFDVTADVGKWAVMVLGVSYLLVAQYYHANRVVTERGERTEKKMLENILYGIGTFAILCPALFFGGIFDLLAIALIFGAFYFSVFVKSRTMLLSAALFLMIYIIKITSKYFAESISWPLALIVVGFLVIAVGYGTFYINRKFLSLK
jgi:uncharacterized membrane protein